MQPITCNLCSDSIALKYLFALKSIPKFYRCKFCWRNLYRLGFTLSLLKDNLNKNFRKFLKPTELNRYYGKSIFLCSQHCWQEYRPQMNNIDVVRADKHAKLLWEFAQRATKFWWRRTRHVLVEIQFQIMQLRFF